jgi:nitroimidazol reductase NimA-like FMN-containing flavoprotein (pyridoxamine 5'-phosphate oxidase superfamily)
VAQPSSRAYLDFRQDHAKVHETTVVALAWVARLATIDPDGRPHLVPITFALDGDTLYSAALRGDERLLVCRGCSAAKTRLDVG